MKKTFLFILLILLSSNAWAGVSIDGASLTNAQVADYTGSGITITSPVDYKTIQRSGITADISITGTYSGSPTAIEARFNGGSWATIVASPAGGTFTGTLSSQTQGQGVLEVRYTNDTATSDSVNFFGIGDVYLCAGQSNMSGRGTSNQSYSHASLRASLYGNDNTWKNLVDPYDSATNQVDTISSDTSPAAAGSWIPLLATGIMADRSVPVAFIPCAMGGTSSAEWQPGADHQNRATLYGSCVYRANQAGGVKAVLWWQGESDAAAAVSEATYNTNLDTIANAFNTDLGVSLVAVILQNSTGVSDVNEQAIRDATATAILDNANVLQGPDLSDISSDDTFHLKTNGNLQTAADRWLTALNSAGV